MTWLRGQDPYGRVNEGVKAAQKQFAKMVAISSSNKGGASGVPLTYPRTSARISGAGGMGPARLSFGDVIGAIGDFIAPGVTSVVGSIADVFTGGGTETTGFAGCAIPGQRVDPVTGECRWFAGTASGPESGGQAVVGSFGLPALAPAIVGEINGKPIRRCAKGSVLGTDELCYSKAVLPPRSMFRKWKRPPRPALSRRDEVAIRRAAGAKQRVLTLAKEAGLHASLTKPRSRSSSTRPHAHTVSHNGSN
jgi:hypothetical protein